VLLTACLVLTLTGLDHGQQPPAEGKHSVPTDRYGDPLPEGAVVRLGTVRLRHGRGSTLAFGEDGKSLITFAGDRTLRIWDAASGRLLREQTIPDGDQARNAVLSPDGRLLAFQDFGAMDTLYLWDIGRNELRHQLSVGLDYQLRAAFSPDNRTLVTTQETGEVKAWDVASGESRLLGKQKREALSLSYSADGTLVTLSWEPVVRFWDLKAGRQRSQTAIPEDIVGATVSPDGRNLAIWTFHNEEKDKGLRFLDATTLPVTGKYSITVEARGGPGEARLRVITFKDQVGTLTRLCPRNILDIRWEIVQDSRPITSSDVSTRKSSGLGHRLARSLDSK
jgi:WD40 repeat protein